MCTRGLEAAKTRGHFRRDRIWRLNKSKFNLALFIARLGLPFSTVVNFNQEKLSGNP